MKINDIMPNFFRDCQLALIVDDSAKMKQKISSKINKYASMKQGIPSEKLIINIHVMSTSCLFLSSDQEKSFAVVMEATCD